MSPAHGLAVDNVLQFEAVLANGTAVTASPCSHPDLFWAVLRGGGDASFAVLTSATYRLHPTPMAGVAGVYVATTLKRGAQSVSLLLDGFLTAVPQFLTPSGLEHCVFGGYFYLLNGGQQFLSIFVYNGTEGSAQQSSASYADFLGSHPDDFDVSTTHVYFPVASMNDWHNAIDKGDPTGGALALGSRLVPLSSCSDSGKRAAAVATLTSIGMQLQAGLNGHLHG